MRFLFLSCLICALCALIHAQPWSVSSPDNSITATITSGSSLQYSAKKGNLTVIGNSNLGVTAGGSALGAGATIESQNQTAINETYALPCGKKKTISNICNELTLAFNHSSGKKFKIFMRAYNYGIAFRYRIEGTGSTSISAEQTSFAFPTATQTFSQSWSDDYETMYEQFAAATSGVKAFSVLGKTPDNIWALLAEAAVYSDYCACRLTASGYAYTVTLDGAVSSTLPWQTPWRVVVIGGLNTIIENSSQLVTNCNPPNEIQDMSWIKAGRVSWSWWSEGVSDIAQQKRYIDFAAEMGWEYCLVDEGWRLANLDQLHTYADSKNISLILWYEWTEMDTPEKRAALLSQCQGWGIKGVKVDFMSNDGQDRMKFYDDMVRDAISYKLMVNFHGSTLPRGQQRRWPNIMTWEGVLGAEHYKWSNNPTPLDNTILPYTRNAIGPMDYTPVTFSAYRKSTSQAHELALSVVFESGWLHPADSPDSYNSSPGKPFLKLVPSNWDDTRFIDGYPGQFLVVARQSKENWFIAGINNGNARTVNCDLSFLPNRSYSITMYRDNSAATAIETAQLAVTSPGTLSVKMGINGGFCTMIPNSAVGAGKPPKATQAVQKKSPSVSRTTSGYLVNTGLGISTVALFNTSGRILGTLKTDSWGTCFIPSSMIPQGTCLTRVVSAGKTGIYRIAGDR